jgi:hypothetical protein
MYNQAPYDPEEEERDRLLRKLLGGDITPPEPDEERAAAANRPSVDMSADQFPTPGRTRTPPPEEVSTVGRDETSPRKNKMVDKDGFDWQLLAGILLDAGMNKGRGLGQIIGAYATNQKANERAKEQHQLRLDEIAARKGDTAFDHWYKQQLIEGAADQRDISSGRIADVQGRAEHNWAQNEDPESAKMQAGLQHVIDVANARSDVKHERSDEIASDAAARTAATTKAATDTTNANPKALTEQEKIANAAREESLGMERERLDETKRATALAEDAKQRALEDREADAFRNKNKTALVAMQQARKLQQAFKDQPDDVRGLGTYQREAPAWAPGITPEDVYQRQIFAQLTNPAIKEISGTAVTPSEAQRVNKAFGTGTFATEDEQKSAVNTIADMLSSQLKGAGVGREKVARRIAAEYGLEDMYPEAAPEVAAAALPAPARSNTAANPAAGARELALPMPKVTVKLKPGPDQEELDSLFGKFGGGRLR